MNSQIALRSFDSALSVMAAATALHARADELTVRLSSFRSFDDLLQAHRNYRPSLTRGTADTRELGQLYDAAQETRGDSRRAYMYGKVKRANSIIDRKNWDAAESYYRVDNRVAWWDRYTKQWICYSVTPGSGYQDGAADFYPNSTDLLQGEHAHA